MFAVVLNLWLTRYVKWYFTVSLQGLSLITVRLNDFLRDFPDGPVVKTLCSQHRERGFETWTGNQGAQPKKKPKQTFFTISHLHYLFHEYSNNVSFLVNVYQCLYVFLIHLYDELYEQERN